jgi:pre-mRNA-processing factor 40
MATDRRTANIDHEILQLIFQRIQEKVQRRSEDEKHTADRHQRRAVDALRSRIKHLEPPVRLNDTWEQVRPRIEKFEEYSALDSDDLRQSAFDKFIRRLKDKEEDAEKDRELRDRDRGPRRGDQHDRDSRNGSYRPERRLASSRPSRTPEPDPYEADRRKAQADRERSYRKVSGLSPVRERREDRERRDRDRERDRDRDRRGLSHYERERRDREEERERLYRTRGDPRGNRDELDYGGDARSTVSNDRRRRRDSDAESITGRSAKRYRRDERENDRSRDHSRRDRDRRSRDSRTPAITEEESKKEEKAVHSGSEEGEIEED